MFYTGTCLCVIETCFNKHFIIQVDDLSIRDNSTHCLVTMVKQFNKVPHEREELQALIMQSLLSEVKLGLRDKTEVNIKKQKRNIFLKISCCQGF